MASRPHTAPIEQGGLVVEAQLGQEHLELVKVALSAGQRVFDDL